MEILSRLLHCKHYSKRRSSFIYNCFTLRDKLSRGGQNGLEKSISLIDKKCAGNLCEYISKKQYLQRVTSEPYTFWNISIKQHQLQTELRNGKLIIEEDENCHVSLSVVPQHGGNEDIFNNNKYYLENVFKSIFSMNEVVCCSKDNIEIPFDTNECCMDKNEVTSNLDESKIQILLSKTLRGN